MPTPAKRPKQSARGPLYWPSQSSAKYGIRCPRNSTRETMLQSTSRFVKPRTSFVNSLPSQATLTLEPKWLRTMMMMTTMRHHHDEHHPRRPLGFTIVPPQAARFHYCPPLLLSASLSAFCIHPRHSPSALTLCMMVLLSCWCWSLCCCCFWWLSLWPWWRLRFFFISVAQRIFRHAL